MEVKNLQPFEYEAWDTFLKDTHGTSDAPISPLSPNILSHTHLHARYVLVHGDSWIGHGATRVVDLRASGARMPFGIIGGLYLDPAYQRLRQAHALEASGEIIVRAARDLRAAGCVGAIVTGQDETTLKKLGFVPHHNEWWIHIPQSQIQMLKRIPTPFFIQQGWTTTCSAFIAKQMMHLYEQFSEGAYRSLADWTQLLRRPHLIYSIVLHKDQLVGYFLMSRVGKRAHVVHECCCPSKEVLFYGLCALRPYLEDDLYLLGPELAMRNMVSWSRDVFQHSTFYKGNMGMITLFKPHQVLEHWLSLNAEVLKTTQLRTHQTTPLTLDFYHHADLVHKLQLHQEFNFLFESNLRFLARRNRPAPAVEPVRLYCYWADTLQFNTP